MSQWLPFRTPRLVVVGILALVSALLGCGSADGGSDARTVPARGADGTKAQSGDPADKSGRPTEDGDEAAVDEETDDGDGAVTGDGAGADDDCYGAEPFLCDVERAITRLTNVRRGSRTPLIHHARLAFVSRDWSEKQRAAGSISHEGFPSARAAVYRQKFGAREVSIYAENVAYTFASNATADEVAAMFVDMWWNSSGHRRNMEGEYALLGSGVSRSGNAFYATQIFGAAD